MSAEQWEELRTATWEAWLERDPARAWPPHAARHDGISGEALRIQFNAPGGYVGGWDARPRIIELAEQRLAEVARLRKSNPTAARQIKAPLAAYEARLRAVR